MKPQATPDGRLYSVQVVNGTCRSNWHAVANNPADAERAAEQQAHVELGGQWVADPDATIPWEHAHPDRRDNSRPVRI